MKTKSKIWVIGYFTLVIGALGMIGIKVAVVDPFFHFHKPDTTNYYYSLDNQRSQNDGIMKHFEYDALITGTSMTENFNTSDMDSIFNVESIKVSFEGGSYREINDNLKNALCSNPDLKIIVRGLDMNMFFDHSDRMREDLGEYPTYLYDNNVFNDVKYLYSRDVIFKRVYPMTKARKTEGFVAGITSFDKYSNWMDYHKFGLNAVCSNGIATQEAGTPVHITEEEKGIIYNNIYQNVVALAKEYPDVTFCYFFPPYSAVWWQSKVTDGTIYKQIEAEEYIIEQILECENIKLFSFNNRTDITTDLNHYKDAIHYGVWINSLMLKWMYRDQYLLTKENYKDYVAQELAFYISYDYGVLATQTDYENDYYADALLRKEFSEVEPRDILAELSEQFELNNATILKDQFDNVLEMECVGSLQREWDSSVSVADYLINTEYVGGKVSVEDIDNYKYLVFCGKKNSDHGQPSVYIYDKNGNVLTEFTANYRDIDGQWHQYMIDISKITGGVMIIFNGGYIDSTGRAESSYTFGSMMLY